MDFIGKETCSTYYDYTDTDAFENLYCDIYIDDPIVLFKNRLNESRSIVIIDEKHINYSLYKKYSRKYRVAEIANISIEGSTMQVEGFIPYIYCLRYWLGYGLKIEIKNLEIIESILSLKLPSSLPYR